MDTSGNRLGDIWCCTDLWSWSGLVSWFGSSMSGNHQINSVAAMATIDSIDEKYSFFFEHMASLCWRVWVLHLLLERLWCSFVLKDVVGLAEICMAYDQSKLTHCYLSLFQCSLTAKSWHTYSSFYFSAQIHRDTFWKCFLLVVVLF